MLVIPAIDLRNGKCVRLWQGKREQETVYSDDPIAMAQEWVERGAQRLHVVDLDGAFEGKPRHLELACQIREVTGTAVQYGGGIRSAEALTEILDGGIDFAIVGTRALSGNFLELAVADFGDRIIASADFRGNKFAVEGWEAVSSLDVTGAASRLTEIGVRTIIMTDIERDGTLGGINTELICSFSQLVPECQLMVAGGVSRVEDITHLKELGLRNLVGVIAGRALYAGSLDLTEAISAARGDDT